MRKLTLITVSLLLGSLAVQGQSKTKWIEDGCGLDCIGCKPSDTTSKCFVLKGKDTLTYTVSTNNCNCDFYTSAEDHKLHPCKGLKLHSIEVHFMYWKKDVTYVKGIKVSETKPHWDSNMGEINMVDGDYEQNGKMVYIRSIHLLHHKLISYTKPYKFTAEWVTLNNY